MRETFGVETAQPYVAPAEATAKLIDVPGRPFVTMSFGVGENPAKRIRDPFEEQIVMHIARRGGYVLIDQAKGKLSYRGAGRPPATTAQAVARQTWHPPAVSSPPQRRSCLASGTAERGEIVLA